MAGAPSCISIVYMAKTCNVRGATASSVPCLHRQPPSSTAPEPLGSPKGDLSRAAADGQVPCFMVECAGPQDQRMKRKGVHRQGELRQVCKPTEDALTGSHMPGERQRRLGAVWLLHHITVYMASKWEQQASLHAMGQTRARIPSSHRQGGGQWHDGACVQNSWAALT